MNKKNSFFILTIVAFFGLGLSASSYRSPLPYFTNISLQFIQDGIPYEDTLIIEGNNIWIRSTPRVGKVVFTLNEGIVCYVLEKGEEQTIRGNRDFWYKIEYEGRIGWVFGSQTSIRQNPVQEFKDFLEIFVTVISKKDTVNIQNLVSSNFGFEYTYLVCKMEGMGVYEHVAESYLKTVHLSRGSDLVAIMPDFEDFYWIEEYYKNGEFTWKEITKDVVEVVVDYLISDDLTMQFKLIEGKWYLHSIKETVCYEALGI